MVEVVQVEHQKIDDSKFIFQVRGHRALLLVSSSEQAQQLVAG